MGGRLCITECLTESPRPRKAFAPGCGLRDGLANVLRLPAVLHRVHRRRGDRGRALSRRRRADQTLYPGHVRLEAGARGRPHAGRGRSGQRSPGSGLSGGAKGSACGARTTTAPRCPLRGGADAGGTAGSTFSGSVPVRVPARALSRPLTLPRALWHPRRLTPRATRWFRLPPRSHSGGALRSRSPSSFRAGVVGPP